MGPDLGVTLQLVRRAQGGDLAALDPLFQRYYDRVRRIARVRLGQGLRQRMDSGDIVQETFIAALGAFDRFEVRDESSLLQWLSVLLENRIRDASDWNDAARRAASRERPLVADGRSGAITLDLAATGLTPAESAVGGEEAEALEQALAALPEQDRELIVLRDYIGMTWEEVAKRLGRPSADAARMAHGKVLLELAARLRARRADA
jgi:RNA polymerase sigma-70 factor (ECF subfamily)